MGVTVSGSLREEERGRRKGKWTKRGARTKRSSKKVHPPKQLLYRDQKLKDGNKAQGLARFKAGVVVRSPERSQDTVVGTCDAERLIASIHFDMLNRHIS